MNKLAIWGIIGLMSAALIGVIVLQGYWINWSYQLSNNQFREDVYTSLNRVANKLQRIEYEEEEEAMREAIGASTFGSDSNKRDSIAVLSDNNEKQECQCPDCQQKKLEEFREKERIRHRIGLSKSENPEPITERIDLKILDDALCYGQV